MMFDNCISVQEFDVKQSVFNKMVAALDKDFGFMCSGGCNDITGGEDFVRLYDLTKEFYKEMYVEVYENYVPLYMSLWKQRLKDVINCDNIHQDSGIHFFSKNGYQSRMMNIWTNIYKDQITGTSESDLGIFVVENDRCENKKIYEIMEKENAHFMIKKKGEIMDIMHVAGPVIKCDTENLSRRYFDFKEGTSICFNSHLLHGSKKHSGGDIFSDEDLEKFRVSLTGVWIHRDDLDQSVLDIPESEHEKLYLKIHERDMWQDLKVCFPDACNAESARLSHIKNLAKAAV